MGKFKVIRMKAEDLAENGKFKEALKLVNDFLFKKQNVLASDHEEIIDAKLLITEIFFDTEQYNEAIQVLNEVLEAQTTKYGANNLKTLDTKVQIIRNLQKLKCVKDALRLCDEISGVNILTYSRDALLMMKFLHVRAELLKSAGKFSESIEVYKQVLPYEERYFNVGHYFSVFTKSKLANLLTKVSKFEEALKIINDILGIKTADLENEEIDIETFKLYHLEMKSDILSQLERYEECIDNFNEVIKQQKNKYGHYDMKTLMTRNNMCLILIKMKKHSEALSVVTDILKIMKLKFGEHYIDDYFIVKINKAEILERMDKLDDALQVYNKILAARTQHLGEDDYRTMQAKNYVSKLLTKMERYDDAMISLNEQIQLSEETYGEEHVETLSLLEEKAALLNELGLLDEALDLLNFVLDKRIKVQGKDHRDAMVTLTAILMMTSTSCADVLRPDSSATSSSRNRNSSC